MTTYCLTNFPQNKITQNNNNRKIRTVRTLENQTLVLSGEVSCSVPCGEGRYSLDLNTPCVQIDKSILWDSTVIKGGSGHSPDARSTNGQSFLFSRYSEVFVRFRVKIKGNFAVQLRNTQESNTLVQ